MDKVIGLSCSRRANTPPRSSARASGAGGVGWLQCGNCGNCSQAERRFPLDCQPEVPAALGASQAWRLKPCTAETAGVASRVPGAGRTPQQSSLATAANGGGTVSAVS